MAQPTARQTVVQAMTDREAIALEKVGIRPARRLEARKVELKERGEPSIYWPAPTITTEEPRRKGQREER